MFLREIRKVVIPKHIERHFSRLIDSLSEEVVLRVINRLLVSHTLCFSFLGGLLRVLCHKEVIVCSSIFWSIKE